MRKLWSRDQAVAIEGHEQIPLDMGKLQKVIREELYGLHLRLLLVNMSCGLLPFHVGNRLRVYGLRLAGFHIGHGTIMYGMPTITGSGDLYQRLRVGRLCQFNIGCILDLEDHITLGDQVGIGHQVMIMTSSHEIGGPDQRADPYLVRASVTIGAGSWLGARCIIFPGVTIGAGSVIAAGTVVNKDVPPNTLVTGTQRISLERWRVKKRSS